MKSLVDDMLVACNKIVDTPESAPTSPSDVLYYWYIPVVLLAIAVLLLFVAIVVSLYKKPCFLFPNVLKRQSSNKNCTERLFLVILGKIIFLSPENMVLLFRRKVKDIFLKIIHQNMIISLCLVKMGFLFHTNMIVPFCQKSKDDLLPKNTLKNDISSIIKKDDIH